MTRAEEMTVAELAARHPVSTQVMYRHGIEFCTGASRPLREACREAAVELDAVLAEVEREEASGTGASVAWAERPLADLVDHLEGSFHAVERREMERLRLLLQAAAGSLPGLAELLALADVFARMRDDLVEHMVKEETVLFPWLRSGRGALARTPIQVMMMEHEAMLQVLNQVRDRRRAFAAAAASATPTAAIVSELGELDRHVREHMHLENNILFTRALRGDE